MYLEFKGFFSGVDRSKLLAVKKHHPTMDLRLIFEKNNWISSKRISRYSDWADRHGFQYHVGFGLPELWISEIK